MNQTKIFTFDYLIHNLYVILHEFFSLSDTATTMETETSYVPCREQKDGESPKRELHDATKDKGLRCADFAEDLSSRAKFADKSKSREYFSRSFDKSPNNTADKKPEEAQGEMILNKLKNSQGIADRQGETLRQTSSPSLAQGKGRSRGGSAGGEEGSRSRGMSPTCRSISPDSSTAVQTKPAPLLSFPVSAMLSETPASTSLSFNTTPAHAHTHAHSHASPLQYLSAASSHFDLTQLATAHFQTQLGHAAAASTFLSGQLSLMGPHFLQHGFNPFGITREGFAAAAAAAATAAASRGSIFNPFFFPRTPSSRFNPYLYSRSSSGTLTPSSSLSRTCGSPALDGSSIVGHSTTSVSASESSTHEGRSSASPKLPFHLPISERLGMTSPELCSPLGVFKGTHARSGDLRRMERMLNGLQQRESNSREADRFHRD